MTAHLVEPIALQDVLVSGSLELEPIGKHSFRLVAFVAAKNVMDGSEERIVVARLVGEREAFLRIGLVIMRLAEGKSAGPEFDDLVIAALEGGVLQ